MTAYAPYGVRYECAEFGLSVWDRPSPLGPIRLYSDAPRERGVVFLHGVGQSWASWTPLLQAARELDLDTSAWVLVDLPGFGGSADLPDRVTLESVGAAVLGALGAHGLREIAVVGHSMGGFLVLDLLARASAGQATPAITGGLALSGAYAGIVDFVNKPLALTRRRPALAAAWSGLWFGSLLGSRPAKVLARSSWAVAGFARTLKLVAAHPRQLPRSFVKSLLVEVRPRSFRIAARTGVDYDCARTWSRIRLPVTAVFGETDRLVDAEDRRVLAQSCPSARIVVLPDTGHFTPIERPHEVARLVAEL
jgi:pimeloyl-ACP methyl ester carboxylesterase